MRPSSRRRPLDSVDPVVFIDAIKVKICDGQAANRPIYVALEVTCDGERDVPGLWAGEHGDGAGAKFWMKVLTPDKEPGRERRVQARARRAEAPVVLGWPQTLVQPVEGCLERLRDHL